MDKMIRKSISFEIDQWEIKAEGIRRELNLNSKSEAVRHSVDKTYSDLGLDARNSEAELKGVKYNE